MIERKSQFNSVNRFLLYLFVGSFQRCSKAADRMEKKRVNPDIESDYERADENRSTVSLGKNLFIVFDHSP